MNMKNLLWQVCTPEQAEKLKSLGVTQSQSCYYFQHGQLQYVPQHFKVEAPDAFAAYTSTELGIMLPYYFETVRMAAGDSYLTKSGDVWTCEHEKIAEHGFTMSATEALARANMLICLLRDGKINVDEVNSRLEAAVVA
jgi:hypothetical protein